MKNGDIANFRLSNCCSRRQRHAAAGDGRLSSACPSPSTPTSRSRPSSRRSSATAAPSSSTPIASTSRRRASRRRSCSPASRRCCRRTCGSTWCRSRASRRWARKLRAAGRHAVQPRRGQGAGRLHQGARARRARCSCTRTPARRARSARRWRRCASSSASGKSTFIGIDAAIDLEYTTKNDEETVCHFCPNECKRTFIDTTPPDGTTSRYIAGFSLREGHRRERRRRCSRSSPSARRSPKQFPNLVDYESKQRVHALLRRGADARGRHADQGHRACKKGFFGIKPRRGHAPLQALVARERGKRAAGAHRHPARAQPLLDRARASGRTSRRSASRSRTSSSATRRPKRCGSRAASTARSIPATREGRAGAHPQPALPRTTRPRRSRSTTSSSRSSRTCRTSSTDTMDNASCPIVAGAPDVMKAAFTKEVDFFATRGIEYLDPALSFVEPTLMARRMFETFGPRLGITEDENDSRRTRGVAGARRCSSDDLQDEGPRDPRDGRGREPRRHPDARPPVPLRSGPEPRHPRGVPGPRLPDPVVRSIPQGPRVPRPLLQGGAREGHDQDAARDQPRVAGELLGQQRAEGVGGEVRGAPPERGRARSLVASSAATTRRPTASSTDHRRRARRRTRRCTTSTRTSRAGRSRSA